MVNYQLGKIYKIVCNETGLVYVGSTCEPTLAKRLTKHVCAYKRYLSKLGHYISSFKVIENDNYEILLIELYPCNSKDELHTRESYWTNQIDCINKVRNQGLLNELGKKEYNKNYNAINKNKISKTKRQYYEMNKQNISKYQKQYYGSNKDKVNQRNKQYNEANQELIKRWKHTSCICECGCCYTKANKARHMKSSQHKDYERNKINYTIQEGLNLIKKLDEYFSQ